MKDPRRPEEIQQELSQHVYGLGELQYNYESYEKNKDRVLAKIREISKELDASHIHYQAQAKEKHEEAIKASNGSAPKDVSPAPEMQQ